MLEQLSVTRRLVEQVLAQPISSGDRQRVALQLLDWLGCVAGAKDSAAAHSFAAFAAEQPGSCTSLWAGPAALDAALAYNGALGNVLEMDDVHRQSILHPGPVVIPAALAMAEHRSARLEPLLDAILLGYEVTIRIGRAVGRSHYHYFHNTSTCAAFGAAMAAGYLLGLEPSQLVSALGNVGSRTGGLWQMRHEPVLTKQWHNAEAAKSGVNAARLAQHGVTGPEYILEGPQGFFQAFSNDADASQVLVAESQWLAHCCTFKPWPACRHAHPAIDAVSRCLTQAGLGQAADKQIATVTIGCYQDAISFCDKPNPSTENQAKFSIQHAVAALILWGEPALEHYQPQAFNDPNVAQFRQRVQVKLEDKIEQNYPRHFGASAQIELTNGQVFELSICDTYGDPEQPMSTSALVAKAQLLMRYGGVAATQIAALTDLLSAYSAGSDVSVEALLKHCRLSCSQPNQQGVKA